MNVTKIRPSIVKMHLLKAEDLPEQQVQFAGLGAEQKDPRQRAQIRRGYEGSQD
jgi:hypothetical protein